MSLNFQKIVQWAQALSPKRYYNPETSPDYPLLKAVVESVDVALATVTPQSNYTFSGTITGDVAASPSTVFTVTGSNSIGAVILLSLYAEDSGGVGAGATAFVMNVYYTYLGSPTARNITFGMGVNPTKAADFAAICPDIGTDVTWEYSVSSFTSGSTTLRMTISAVQLI